MPQIHCSSSVFSGFITLVHVINTVVPGQVACRSSSSDYPNKELILQRKVLPGLDKTARGRGTEEALALVLVPPKIFWLLSLLLPANQQSECQSTFKVRGNKKLLKKYLTSRRWKSMSVWA